MAGRPQKLASTRQGHRDHGRVLQLVVPPKKLRAPAMPRIALDAPALAKHPEAVERIAQAVRARWREMWRSAVAVSWDDASDRGRLTRYLMDYHRWLVFDELVRLSPVVRGSEGQVRANPLLTQMNVIDARLVRVEEAFGMTPRDRMRLGVDLSAMILAGARAAEAMADASDPLDEYAVPAGWEIAE